MVAGDDVANSKPHPEPYLTAADAARRRTGATAWPWRTRPRAWRRPSAAGCRVVAIPHIADIDVQGAYIINTLEGWTLESLWAAAGA